MGGNARGKEGWEGNRMVALNQFESSAKLTCVTRLGLIPRRGTLFYRDAASFIIATQHATSLLTPKGDHS